MMSGPFFGLHVISWTKTLQFSVKTFFSCFGLHLNSGTKSLQISVKTFFCLHLICFHKKNRGRASSPPMLKIGQNWGKIANYPPNAQYKSALLKSTNCLWSRSVQCTYTQRVECTNKKLSNRTKG